MKRYQIYFIPLLISLFIACTENKQSNKNVLATVNDRIITQEEFRLFYELDPNFGLDSLGLPALKDELNFNINQILALEKAEKERLTSDSMFIRAVNWELRQAMLRELFCQDVQNKVEISEKEVMQAYINNNMMVHVRHIFTKLKDEIVAYQKKLQKGISFSDLARKAFSDSVLAGNSGDLGWIRLGDLDQDFGSAIINLTGKEISDIIQTKWGFHLIQLLDFKKQVILNESDFQRQKPVLEKKIRRQKSVELSAKYIRTFMTQQNPQPDERIFRLIWNEVLPATDREKLILPRQITFSNSIIEKCAAGLKPYLKESFINYRDGYISLKGFLDGMRVIPLSHRPVFKSARELSDQIGLWVRDEFLLKKTKKKGLDKNPKVMKEVQRFKEEQSYNFFLNEKMNNISIPDSILSYFKNKTTRRPELARFHTLQEWQWNKAKKQLDEEIKKIPAEIFIDFQKLEEENKRINWDRRIRMFMVRKPG